MNQIFDRFIRLVRSSVLDVEIDEDRDFAESWQELNDFLNNDFLNENFPSKSENRNGDIPPLLREDYKILGLEKFSSFGVIKKRYIHLIRENHPDKFAHDPDRQAQTTEHIKSINAAFEHIRKWELERNKN